MKSSNGGTTWTIQDSTFPPSRSRASRFDECTAVGGTRCIEDDRRNTWNLRRLPRVVSSLSECVVFQFKHLCCRWRSDSYPSIIGTQDGTTGQILTSPYRFSLSAISCATPDHMRCRPDLLEVAVQVSIHLTSNDGHLRYSTWPEVNSVACPDETTCIAVGTNLDSASYVIGTSNNGSTWSLQGTPPTAVDLTGISCSAPEDCIAVGNSGNTGAGQPLWGRRPAVCRGSRESTDRNGPAELCLVPEHNQLLHGPGSTRSCGLSTLDTHGAQTRYQPRSTD